ncbi:DoxX family protein [Nocardia sp. NPDC023852]|uniref:DoxX family protein n=1 Tax=Nocardia sp. NPDC023852 TaxID=3154697 RepID=UPI0033E63E31
MGRLGLPGPRSGNDCGHHNSCPSARRRLRRSGCHEGALAGVGRADAERFGFSHTIYRGIGLLEILGGAGLLIGATLTAFWWIGVAAAVGLIALTVGALATHLRVGDPLAKAAGAPLFGIVAAITASLIYLNSS